MVEDLLASEEKDPDICCSLDAWLGWKSQNTNASEVISCIVSSSVLD